MNAIQVEYIRNARKAILIASSIKFNSAAYGIQASRAEAFWLNYLKSSRAKNLQMRAARLRELLAAHDTDRALNFISA
jgi:hypothetical protein